VASVALVTGGGTGIGLACAEALAQLGWTVVIAGRRNDVLDQAAQALSTRCDGEVVAHRADVGDPDQITPLVDAVITDQGQIDALICAAAVYDASPVTELSASDWDSTLGIVLRGAALTAFAVAKHMRERGSGRVVLISSINASASEPEQSAYSAAKAGVSSVARSMAVELSRTGIAVNAVLPGWVRTPMTEEWLPEISAETWERISPVARVGEPQEIANLVRYLVTDAPAFLTGASLVIDGGQTAMAAMP
jgi:NAD(P)-dependent dehydrogenase (short-subunit alcohol dehydrogenase family)